MTEPNATLVPPAAAGPLLTLRQVAEHLSVSTRSVERWLREPPRVGPPLRFVRLGRRRLFRPGDVAAFIDGRVFENTSQADEARRRGAGR